MTTQDTLRSGSLVRLLSSLKGSHRSLFCALTNSFDHLYGSLARLELRIRVLESGAILDSRNTGIVHLVFTGPGLRVLLNRNCLPPMFANVANMESRTKKV